MSVKSIYDIAVDEMGVGGGGDQLNVFIISP